MRKSIKKTVKKPRITTIKSTAPAYPYSVEGGLDPKSVNCSFNTPEEIVQLIKGHGNNIIDANMITLDEYRHRVKVSAERVLFLLRDLKELP